MARLPRLEIPAFPHLVAQRVLPGELLVRDATDRQALRSAMLEATRAHGVAVHAYAIAPDHLHLLATPAAAGGLSGFMQAVGRRYVALYNRRHGRQGGLWAGRYRATVVEPAQYLLEAMAFIELQEGGLAHGEAASSLAHHLGRWTDPLVQDHALFWGLGNTPFDREAAWRRRLEDGQGAAMSGQLAEAMRKGWVLGSPAFIQGLQAAAARPLSPRPRGRPRKSGSPSPEY